MARKTTLRIWQVLRSAGLPALVIIFMGFFGYYAVMGPNGIVAYRDYHRQIAARQAEYAKLDKQRAVIRNRVDLLDRNHADPDLVDELVRAKLNVVHPNERVLELKQTPSPAH
jgi:cell division protein FtsB